MAASADYAHLVGHRFPAGRYRLPAYVCWLWADAAGLEPDAAMAHPGLVWVVALEGAGITVQDVFDLMDAGTEDGVLLGECGASLHGTLRPGTDYACEGVITGVERKRGRRAGVFDRLSFQVTVREAAAGGTGGSVEPLAVVRAAWIFPRSSAP